MKVSEQKHYSDTLMALLAFAVFAASIIAVLLAGAGVYNRIVEKDTASYNSHTGCRYITTKIRSSSGAGSISSITTEAGSTLCIAEKIGDRSYITYIYCSDGWLMEQFAPADSMFSPSAGEKLLPMENAEFDCSNRLARIRLTDSDGTDRQVFVSLRGGAVS